MIPPSLTFLDILDKKLISLYCCYISTIKVRLQGTDSPNISMVIVLLTRMEEIYETKSIDAYSSEEI